MSETDRRAWIEGLRGLADVLAKVPELPLPTHAPSLQVPLSGCDDADAAVKLGRIEAALRRQGVPYAAEADDHSRRVIVAVGPVRFCVFHVYDAAMARHGASSRPAAGADACDLQPAAGSAVSAASRGVV